MRGPLEGHSAALGDILLGHGDELPNRAAAFGAPQGQLGPPPHEVLEARPRAAGQAAPKRGALAQVLSGLRNVLGQPQVIVRQAAAMRLAAGLGPLMTEQAVALAAVLDQGARLARSGLPNCPG